MDFYYRVDFNEEVRNKLLLQLEDEDLRNLFINAKKIKKSSKRIKAVAKASSSKIASSKQKILKAIEILKERGRPVNAYQVAKEGKINYNTAYKYKKEFGY